MVHPVDPLEKSPFSKLLEKLTLRSAALPSRVPSMFPIAFARLPFPLKTVVPWTEMTSSTIEGVDCSNESVSPASLEPSMAKVTVPPT